MSFQTWSERRSRLAFAASSSPSQVSWQVRTALSLTTNKPPSPRLPLHLLPVRLKVSITVNYFNICFFQGVWCVKFSAISLTICIALFHGKCHLLQRRPILADVTLAHRDVIEAARRQHFGWSFALAWICVALCFVHTWVWLVKAQQIQEKFSTSAGASLRRDRSQQAARRRARERSADTSGQSHDNNAVSLDE